VRGVLSAVDLAIRAIQQDGLGVVAGVDEDCTALEIPAPDLAAALPLF